jgi:hypothetical protein
VESNSFWIVLCVLVPFLVHVVGISVNIWLKTRFMWEKRNSALPILYLGKLIALVLWSAAVDSALCRNGGSESWPEYRPSNRPN